MPTVHSVGIHLVIAVAVTIDLTMSIVGSTLWRRGMPVLTYTCVPVLSSVGSGISVGHISIRATSVCAGISIGACIPVCLSHRNPA